MKYLLALGVYKDDGKDPLKSYLLSEGKLTPIGRSCTLLKSRYNAAEEVESSAIFDACAATAPTPRRARTGGAGHEDLREKGWGAVRSPRAASRSPSAWAGCAGR